MSKLPTRSRPITALLTCLGSLSLILASQAQTPVNLRGSFSGPKPSETIKTLDEAKQVTNQTKSVAVGFLKDKSQAPGILKELARKENITSISLRTSAIQPESISELRKLNSLRSLTLDRRHYGLGSPELHKAVSDLSQLTSLHIRWIDLAGP